MRTVLLVGSDDVLLLRTFQSATTATKVACLVPDGSPAADALRQSRWCLGVEQTPTDGRSFTREQIEEAASRVGATHLVPVALQDAAVLGRGGDWDAVTFPCVDAVCLDRIHDKWSLATVLRGEGIPAPDTILANGPGEALEAAAGWDFEAVLKPRAGSGGASVVVCHGRAEVADAIESRSTWPCLVQRFVPGIDRDVSVLAYDGEVLAAAVQDRFLTRGLRFVADPVALGHASALVRATGYSGIAHVDMRRHDDGSVWVIECNPRMYATMHLAAYAGLDFVTRGLDAADGWRPRSPVLVRPGTVVPPRDARELVRRPWRAFSRGTARAALATARDLRFVRSRAVAAEWGSPSQMGTNVQQ